MTRRFNTRRFGLLGAICLMPGLTHADAASASISASELVEVTDIDSLSVSPDGLYLIFRTQRADIGRNSYILRWHCVSLAEGTARDVGSGGDPIYLDPGSVQPESPVWTADGRFAVVRALADGGVGLWRLDTNGGGMLPLVASDADVEDYSAAGDGRTITYKLGPSREAIGRAEQKEYDSGILVDSSIDLGQNLYRGGSINGRMSTQRLVGYWYVRAGLLWRAPRQRHRVDVLTGADSTLGPPETVQPFAPPAAASLQSRNAAGEVAEARWEGGKGSATATFADGRKTACIDPMCSTARIAALSWRPASHDVMVTFLDRERRQSLYLWSLEPNSLRKVAESDGLLAGGRRHMVPCALSASAAFCIAASPGSPPRLERIELESGARQVLFDPNPELRSAYRPEVTYLRWAIGDGRDAAGVLLQPPGKAGGSMPLYVNYYSCEGFLRGGEGDEWPLPQLLDAGFAAACINAVPSTGPQDGVKEYETGLAAVRTLVGKLSREGIVDPSRVAMGGLSFGSEVAMWTAIHSRLLAALSISSAQLEPADYWASAMPGSDQPSIIDRVWKLGTPGQTPVRWREVSPALNTGRIQVPILFQLPEQEARRIPELYARLAMAGVPTELYAFPDEAHIKVQPRHRLAVYERNLDWFRYWLQDFMDPDPAKASQYERWNKLKLAWRASRRPSARNVAKVQARPSR